MKKKWLRQRKRIFEIIEVGSDLDTPSRVYDYINAGAIIINLLFSVLYTFDHVREQLGITKAVSNLLPQDKVIELEKVLAESTGTTMFIGDGVNDAPSLTRSDVGVAIGDGTDVAIESADIVLTNGDLSKIPYLVNIATRTISTIKANKKIFALGINDVVPSLLTTVSAFFNTSAPINGPITPGIKTCANILKPWNMPALLSGVLSLITAPNTAIPAR